MSSDHNDVLFEDIGNKGLITLNRPRALNALNLSMIEKIYPVLKVWEKEKLLVIVKGAGGKAFCAGGDVRAVTEAGLKGNSKVGQDFFRKEYITNGLIGSYSIPYIAFIDGIVMGGGVGLSIHGKYRVATEKTLFAMPETQIGLFPDVGGSYFLPRLSGRLGYFLALTGHRLKGVDVLKAGIATHYCESSKLTELEKALLDSSKTEDIKNALNEFNTPPNEEFSLLPYMDKINKCFAPGSVEDILERLEKDRSQWALDTLKLLNRMSPTSLKIAVRELDLGKQMSLQECLQMEYRLAYNCLANNEFFEGKQIHFLILVNCYILQCF